MKALICWLGWLVLATSTLEAAAQSERFTTLVGNLNSVVRIRVDGVAENGAIVSNSGTGFFISSDGYILTAGHLFRTSIGAEASKWRQASEGSLQFKIIVQRPENGKLKPLLETAMLVSSDQQLDLAVLRVAADSEPTVEISCSPSKISVGTVLQGIGWRPDQNVYDLILGRLAPDNISSASPRLRLIGVSHPGNSGSPLFDDAGQVVGILTSGIESAGQPFGQSYAVPLAQSIPLLPESSSCRRTMLLSAGVNHLPDEVLKGTKICVDQKASLKQSEVRFLEATGGVRSAPTGIQGSGDERRAEVTLGAPSGMEILPPAKVSVLSANGNYRYEGPLYSWDTQGHAVSAKIILVTRSKSQIFSPASFLEARLEASARPIIDAETRQSMIADCIHEGTNR